MSPAPTTGPSRWCPTPEQVMILEEIYRNGLKTPNATQIQHITCHLSLYGKIEGKNVFYWFQNHKARDRQKLRRKIYKQLQLQHYQLLLKRCRFDHHPLFDQCFLHHSHTHNQNQNQCPLPMLHLSTGCYHQMEGQEGSTMTKEASCERMWFGRVDGAPVAAENGNGDGETTGSLRTLELFPVKGSCLKEEERENGNVGWGN